MLTPNHTTDAKRTTLLGRIALIAITLLLTKVFLGILWEYRFYFPANFDSAFLGGRRYTFFGLYRSAFYVHIMSGPLALLIATTLIISGGRWRVARLHRWLGRFQVLLVVGVVLPNGLLMARQAYAGPIAGWGFAMLSLSTAWCVVAAANAARAGRFAVHQRWAVRCYLLLCSPLLLRLVSGTMIVTGLESDWTYRANAWLSWIVPWLAYEAWLRRSSAGQPDIEPGVQRSA